jgi:TPR repeat protein
MIGRLAAIALAVLAPCALIAFLLTPTTVASDVRRAAAVVAVRAGVPALGVALFRPLAQAGDAAAANDLAVLVNRGIGAARDPVEAARLLNAAANAGLPRARLNLTLIRTPCDTSHGLETAARLEAFADAGDRRAASFVPDCLRWSGTTLPPGEATRRLIAAAEIATRGGDADEELKFGWLLMKQARGLEAWQMDDAARRAAAEAAARYLFAAAEHGRAAAYEAIAALAQHASSYLGPSAARVAARKPDDWIDVAARAGHPKSRCAVGARLATGAKHQAAALSEADRQRVAEYFDSCWKGRDPRQVIFRNGREETVGHDPLFDIWMKEHPFLIWSPRYDNYDYDIVGREDAIARMIGPAPGK